MKLSQRHKTTTTKKEKKTCNKDNNIGEKDTQVMLIQNKITIKVPK